MSHFGITTRRMRSGGFTLHQLLCCLALIPITLMVMVALFSRTSKPSYVNSTRSHVSMLEDAVSHYMIDVGRCPTTEEGFSVLFAPPPKSDESKHWKGPYLDKAPPLPLDPWKHPYQYEADAADHFVIWSNGPDGQPCTDDDISTEL